jgi:hypothetical protein
VTPEEAVRQTIGRYVHANDEARLDDLADLFLEDGVLQPPGLPEYRGHEAIKTFVAASRASRDTVPGLGRIRHHVASVSVEVVGPDLAHAVCYFMAVSARGPDHWGSYRDELAPAGDGAWRFRRRTVTLDGADPAGWIGSGSGVVPWEAG